MPYTGEGATGFSSPMKLMFRPKRRRVPIYLAAMGPKNVRLTLELADGIMPPIFSPSREWALLGELSSGLNRIVQVRNSLGLSALEVVPMVPVSIGKDVDVCRRKLKAGVAFYLGSGVKGYSFYFDLAVRYGWEEPARKIA